VLCGRSTLFAGLISAKSSKLAVNFLDQSGTGLFRSCVRGYAVELIEVRKLDAYFKKLFGNARIRVVPRPGADEAAEVYIGEERLGDLNLDDEDEDLSYNFRMEIDLGEVNDAEQIKRLEAYLKRKLDNEAIRVVPRAKKRDSLEAYLGDEFIGVLFVDDEKGRRSYILEMPILDMDLA
jgi:hypothetical protein